MNADLALKLVADFEQGRLSRRELAARLMGLGAALSAGGSTGLAQEASAATSAEPTFRATGLDHIALDVTDLDRSIDFYRKHLGLNVIRGDKQASFLGAGRDFFLTLFRRDTAGLNHYCYSIQNYDADAAMERLAAAGLKPRRDGNRVYFPDPDDITVQLA